MCQGCECWQSYLTKGEKVCNSVCVRVGVGLAWHPQSQQGRAATDVHSLLQLITIVNRCLWVYVCMWAKDIDRQQGLIFTTVCVCLLAWVLMCVRGSACMFPVHILMCQRAVVAAAENSFHSGGAVRADTLHLLPDSSQWVCVHMCFSHGCVCLHVNMCGYLSVKANTLKQAFLLPFFSLIITIIIIYIPIPFRLPPSALPSSLSSLSSTSSFLCIWKFTLRGGEEVWERQRLVGDFNL